MSRDGVSHDPQDTRDEAFRHAWRRHRSSLSDVSEGRSSIPQARDNREPTDAREGRAQRDERSVSTRTYYLRDCAYLLRDSEMNSLREVGKFRVVRAADLAKHAYGGDRDRMERDIRHLKRESLVTEKNIEISKGKALRVVTLTKTGHRLLKDTKHVAEEQTIYHGFVKPREAKHDADLYRLYQKEAARLERAGSRPVRVILDYELKRNLNRDLALLGQEKDDPDRRSQVAAKHGLAVVDGKIPVPDLRLEYETPDLELQRVDLELATRDYRPRALAEKARAGFSLYGRPEDASRLRRILDERELTARILTL